MALISPFAPSAGSTVGNTVKVTANATPTSVNAQADWTKVMSNQILITNNGTVLVFVRVSGEAAPTATAADLPVRAGESRVIENPVPNSVVGLAVLSSTTTACDVYFTPGLGGV